MNKIDLVLLAAGKGSRTGETIAKQFLVLGKTPVMIRALRPFTCLEFIGRKIVAAPPDHIDLVESLLDEYGIAGCQVISGGDTRQESVRLGLEQVRTDRVITHNAALPFVTEDLIRNVADKFDPCVTTVTPAVYPLCRGGEFATKLIDPELLNMINTPQSFDTRIFLDCHRRAVNEGIKVRTDCELMMRYGHAVRFVPGNPINFKITTPLDVLLAEALVARAAGDNVQAEVC